VAFKGLVYKTLSCWKNTYPKKPHATDKRDDSSGGVTRCHLSRTEVDEAGYSPA